MMELSGTGGESGSGLRRDTAAQGESTPPHLLPHTPPASHTPEREQQPRYQVID